jgi:hypothetical protein
LGTDTAAIGSIHVNTADVTVGGTMDDIWRLRGYVHSAKVWDGAYGTGTLVADFNPDQAPDYGTGQSWDSVNTGETWTGQGSASIDAVNTLVHDTFTDADGTLLTDHQHLQTR